MSLVAVIAVAFGLSFVNGANDVSKGIATLVGSGVSD
jgi:phosphate/sulfate permease